MHVDQEPVGARTPAGSLCVLWFCERTKGWSFIAPRVQHLARDLALQAGFVPQARADALVEPSRGS